jgi:protein-tyrosine phosphatase
MAECVFRHVLVNATGERVLSAGIAAVSGTPIHELACGALVERGYALPQDLTAVRLTAPMLTWADLVLVMEATQRRKVIATHPVAAGKIWTLGHWLSREIIDPVCGDKQTFDATLDLIERSANSWLPVLTQSFHLKAITS